MPRQNVSVKTRWKAAGRPRVWRRAASRVETGTSHVETGSSHVETGSSHVETGSSHVETASAGDVTVMLSA